MNDSTPAGWENPDVIAAAYLGIAIGAVGGHFTSLWWVTAIVGLSIFGFLFLIYLSANSNDSDAAHA
jgi:hypothetical protein